MSALGTQARLHQRWLFVQLAEQSRLCFGFAELGECVAQDLVGLVKRIDERGSVCPGVVKYSLNLVTNGGS